MSYKRWTCHGEDLSTSSSMTSRRPTNAASVCGSPNHERQTLGAEDREILEDLHPKLFEANAEPKPEHQHPILRQEAEDDSSMPVNNKFKHLLRDV